MRWVVALACVVASTVARADTPEAGLMLGVRNTSLAGEVRDGDRLNFAAALVIAFARPSGFEIGIEPGLRWSGSHSYRLVHVVMPVVGGFVYPLSKTHRVRVMLGLTPSLLAFAQYYQAAENGYEWTDLPGVSWWDVDALAGIGYERVTSQRRYRVELRVARGLTSVDGDAMPLAIFRREIGLWVGFTR